MNFYKKLLKIENKSAVNKNISMIQLKIRIYYQIICKIIQKIKIVYNKAQFLTLPLQKTKFKNKNN